MTDMYNTLSRGPRILPWGQPEASLWNMRKDYKYKTKFIRDKNDILVVIEIQVMLVWCEQTERKENHHIGRDWDSRLEYSAGRRQVIMEYLKGWENFSQGIKWNMEKQEYTWGLGRNNYAILKKWDLFTRYDNCRRISTPLMWCLYHWWGCFMLGWVYGSCCNKIINLHRQYGVVTRNRNTSAENSGRIAYGSLYQSIRWVEN